MHRRSTDLGMAPACGSTPQNGASGDAMASGSDAPRLRACGGALKTVRERTLWSPPAGPATQRPRCAHSPDPLRGKDRHGIGHSQSQLAASQLQDRGSAIM
eukprot:SAG25_NODE_407_length_8435_cov_46.995082_8_plen_101_part_00